MSGAAHPVELTGIWTGFGGTAVHRGIDLAVPSGQKLALVGGSGSGKTTLMRIMLGLLAPQHGAARLFGRDLEAVSDAEQQMIRNRCGVLFQNGALFTDLNIFDNIALPLRELDALDEETIAELVCMKLFMVRLDERVGGLMPFELSGGMVKRAALARALALEPDLLFLDEPTSGLDPLAAENFVHVINRLHRDLRFTMVMVTHDVHSLHDLCDQVAVLADGELVAHGPIDSVIESEHSFVHHFFRGGRSQPAFGAEGT